MVKDSNSRVSITLSNDLYDRIKEEAKKENRSVSNYILNIILEKLN